MKEKPPPPISSLFVLESAKGAAVKAAPFGVVCAYCSCGAGGSIAPSIMLGYYIIHQATAVCKSYQAPPKRLEMLGMMLVANAKPVITRTKM